MSQTNLGVSADKDSSTGHQSNVVTTTSLTGVSKEGHTKKKVNDTATAQGSKLARPIGLKKAKKLAKMEEETARPKQSLESGLSIMRVTKKLVAAFKANTVLNVKDLQA